MMIVTTMKLLFSADQFIRHESEQRVPYETGGILLGRFTDTCAEVAHAVGPGPHARHTKNGFTRDGAYTQDELDAMFVRSGGQFDYLGEWHSHPLPYGPSCQDRESLTWISTNPAYSQPHPLLLIQQRVGRKRWKTRVWQRQEDAFVELTLAVVGDDAFL